MFSILESVAFDTGYAGSAGLVPQSWVNGNGTSYIYYGAGEFDGQGSGDDFWGTVIFLTHSVLVILVVDYVDDLPGLFPALANLA
jgi:hypothetical protein